MAKQKRKPHKKPMSYPLSKADKLVYNATAVILTVLAFGSLIIPLLVSRAIAFSEPSVIAMYQDGVLILCHVPLIIFFTSLAVAAGVSQNKRKPLFDNKSFKPRDRHCYKKETPVFTKEFWQNMSEKAKVKLYFGAVIGVLAFAISLFIASMGICPRDVLLESGEIKKYNSSNKVTEIHNIENTDKLVISIWVNRSKSGTSYNINCRFVFNENEFAFDHTSFDSMEDKETLEYMIGLKEKFGEKCVIEDTDMVESLCRDRKFSAEEKALVYELFGYNE